MSHLWQALILRRIRGEKAICYSCWNHIYSMIYFCWSCFTLILKSRSSFGYYLLLYAYTHWWLSFSTDRLGITRAAINWYIWLYVASSLNLLEIHKNIYPKGLKSLLTIQHPKIFKIRKTKTFNQFLNTEIETEKQIDYKAYKQLLLHRWHCSLHNWITLILEIIAWNEMKLQKKAKAKCTERLELGGQTYSGSGGWAREEARSNYAQYHKLTLACHFNWVVKAAK